MKIKFKNKEYELEIETKWYDGYDDAFFIDRFIPKIKESKQK